MKQLKSTNKSRCVYRKYGLLFILLLLMPIATVAASSKNQYPSLTTTPKRQLSHFPDAKSKSQDPPPTEQIITDMSKVTITTPVRGVRPMFAQSSSTISDVETVFYDGMESNPWPYFDTPWGIYYGAKERYWDDVFYNYNDYYGGNWSAWPAAGGDGGKIPQNGDDKYPSNTDSWMIYGPFNLRNSQQALWAFYIWREIAQGDRLFFGYSLDGINFQGWNVTNTDTFWRLFTINMNSLINQPNIWVGWHFVSDDSGSGRGPYIDDIFILREIAASPTGSRVSIPMATLSYSTPPNNTDPCALYEPNNGISTAKPFGNSGNTIVATACSGDTNDFYFFNVNTAGNVQITLNLPASLYKNGSLNVLKDGVETPRGCYKAPPVQGRSGAPVPITATCSVTPGKYYLWLDNLGTGSPTDKYSLQVFYP